MSKLIEGYEAKNFDMKIESYLTTKNYNIDFYTMLDPDQALGAKAFVDIIRFLDENDVKDWHVYGWFDDFNYGNDFDGEKDGVSFFNEAYFAADARIDKLWMDMPCLEIYSGVNERHVWCCMLQSPYMRTIVMQPVYMNHVELNNEYGCFFPGEGACLKIVGENDRRFVNEISFRVPQTYCMRYKMDGKPYVRWWYIQPDDTFEMIDRLHEMCDEKE